MGEDNGYFSGASDRRLSSIGGGMKRVDSKRHIDDALQTIPGLQRRGGLDLPLTRALRQGQDESCGAMSSTTYFSGARHVINRKVFRCSPRHPPRKVSVLATSSTA
jgi:hypothetical protein